MQPLSSFTEGKNWGGIEVFLLGLAPLATQTATSRQKSLWEFDYWLLIFNRFCLFLVVVILFPPDNVTIVQHTGDMRNINLSSSSLRTTQPRAKKKKQQHTGESTWPFGKSDVTSPGKSWFICSKIILLKCILTHRAWGSLCSLLLWLPTVLPSGSPTVCAGVWLLSALTCRLRIPTWVPALGPIPSVHCMVPSDLVDDKQLMAGSWNWVGLKVPCNSNYSMILWILRPSWHPAGWTWTQQPRRLNSSAAISLQIIYIIMLLAHKGRKFSNIPSK